VSPRVPAGQLARRRSMRVHDRVHGVVDLSPLASAVATSVAFERLDSIRQLGGCAYVYPSATHTRREHSIGVAHLAARAGRALQSRGACVSEDDVICLELAGLVHDMGHGPLSHTFEVYLPDWCHERASVAIFDHVMRCDRVRTAASDRFARAWDANVEFVKLIVCGLDGDAPWPGDRVGRDASRRFLVDVVHSRGSGIDVDKLDYLVRDSLAVFGAPPPLMHVGRILSGLRVVGDARLGFAHGVVEDLREVYALRARMHRRVYQHRGVLLAETLLVDLMRAIDSDRPAGSRLCDLAHDPARMHLLVDASVLQAREGEGARVCDARVALCRAHWPVRLDGSVALRTLPACAACAAPTQICDAFCAACGASTADRSPAADREAEEAAAALLEMRGVRTVVTDVVLGACVDRTDPHGRVWRTHDALGCVRFCDERGEAVAQAPCPVAHERVAHFFRHAPPPSVWVA